MKVQKVLNSSVVLAVDEKGRERVLLGKGIGYSSKKGDIIPETQVEKTFVPLPSKESDALLQLLQTVSPQYVELARRIVACAEGRLEATLSSHIYVALTDHLHFAIERHSQGVNITNRMLWEIKKFYPKEFAVGLEALAAVREELGVSLPEEEAGNIAFHIVNAQKENGSMHQTMKETQLLNQLVGIVRYSTNSNIDEESIHYERFISHMHYFIRRMFDGKMLQGQDEMLLRQISEANNAAMKCANQIVAFLQANYAVEIPTEELVYLAIHIQRIVMQE